jgi:hypothetical protein
MAGQRTANVPLPASEAALADVLRKSDTQPLPGISESAALLEGDRTLALDRHIDK